MNKNKRNSILLCAVILRIFVLSTFIALASRLNLFLQDADGAISLIGETEVSIDYSIEENNDNQQNLVISDSGSVVGVVYNITDAIQPIDRTVKPMFFSTSLEGQPQLSTLTYKETPQIKNMYNPGFKTSDDKQVWTTSTQVDIFKVSYVNGTGEITVQSDNGEKVFAPGTENSYTFKLKNTGDVSLEYEVDIKAYFTPSDIDLPIDGRINRYDGKWLTDGDGVFVDVLSLNGVHDEDILAAGKYTYYTLDWVWPYESGTDDVDTDLGDMAVNEDLTLTIEINTTAIATEEPGGGIRIPDTGDNTNNILWMCSLFGSSLLLILLIYYKKNTKDEDEREG